MQPSMILLGLIASLASAVPMTETPCLNEFATCRVNAPMGSPSQCCVSNMVCEPYGGFKSNSTMGTCIKQDDAQQKKLKL